MSVLVMLDAYVAVTPPGGILTDLSDHVKQVRLTYNAAMLDSTAMGGVGTRTRLTGLKEWQVDVQLQADEAVGSINETLFGLIGATPFPIEVRPVKTGGRSPSNPGYTGMAVMSTSQPINGNVGEISMTQATFLSSGVLTRATS